MDCGGPWGSNPWSQPWVSGHRIEAVLVKAKLAREWGVPGWLRMRYAYAETTPVLNLAAPSQIRGGWPEVGTTASVSTQLTRTHTTPTSPLESPSMLNSLSSYQSIPSWINLPLQLACLKGLNGLKIAFSPQFSMIFHFE